MTVILPLSGINVYLLGLIISKLIKFQILIRFKSLKSYSVFFINKKIMVKDLYISFYILSIIQNGEIHVNYIIGKW